jgi:predicted 2-oxoglutarate/Fe(II)-dependent dioxygenase YbiX
MEKKLLTEREDVFTIEGFLTPDECKQYIARAEAIGFGDAPINGPSGPIMNKRMRNNSRVILDDFDLAAHLWGRIAPFMPEHDFWEADGLNERFRFYRYESDQQFDWHFDGSWKAGDRESRLTFMIYLSEGFVGGETDLFGECVKGEVVGGMSVVPKEGMALVFNHNILHRGAPVVSGTKYVIRTDVMTRSK